MRDFGVSRRSRGGLVSGGPRVFTLPAATWRGFNRVRTLETISELWHSRPRLCFAANLHARGRACHSSEIVS